VCGDTAIEQREHLQNIEQRELVMATGAGFERARTSRTVLNDLALSIRRAHVERRPIVFNIPADFQWDDVDYLPLDLVAAMSSPVTDVEALDDAVGAIASSRRPIVLAGGGAIAAKPELVRLATRIGAPLATTLMAKDLFHGERGDLGIFGTFATPWATEVILAAATASSCSVPASINGRPLKGRCLRASV
jgi:acetolactate synthase-1/2/3 large subunit